MRKWEHYEAAAEYGPAPMAWTIGIFGFCLIVVLSSVGYCAGWFSEAAQVAKEQVGPRALLVKYEWFKDASAALDAKQASMKVYEGRFSDLKSAYGKTPRAQWSREDREQWNLWASEVAGIAASYNTLAADYNAQMAKINWAFANAGQLPQGAAVPLPREYKPYEIGAK